MKTIFYYSFMIIIILIIMISLLNLIAKKSLLDREKNSPFECGFDPKNLSRLPFSLQFFMITIIFIIFDVELTLLLPMILIQKTSHLFYSSFMFNIFIFILLVGLIHELKEGTLNWTK